MPEQQIVVVFDVSADDRESAARLVAEVIGHSSITTPLGATSEDGTIESWWFPESDIKHVDGNDNDAMLLMNHELIDHLDDAYSQGDAQWLHACITKISRDLPKL